MSSQHNTLFRYLTLLQLIPRLPGYRATPTLQALLEERGFQVDLRSVQRDLEKMSNNFPLLCDKSQKPYRWSFDSAFKSNLPALDTPTALTLVLAEEYLKGLLPQVAIVQLNNQFTAARKYLEQLKESGFSDWARHVKAIPNGKALIPAPINSSIWAEVTDALLKGIALDVTYLSRAKMEEKQLTLHPLGLVVRHSVTYLLATVDGYEDIRHFALHRIKLVKQSSLVYQPLLDFDIDEYLKKGVFGYRLGEQDIELVAKIRPEIAWLLSETPLSQQQSLSEPDDDGWITLKAIVPDDLQTQWWVMGFGGDIYVLEPLQLRIRIADLIKTMHQQYIDSSI
ncbi:helix-turn-helix transcriptional regulator [Nitrincola tapanii]|uniref:WYL domain-containing protein n=1 Tax=Nitrincola tapanii TaxID=1708751 RepID=A0A5A9WAL1_9GAMM|nr:WYL domain-containing protein [Nitrincola tapanii]KAA0876471.1 WYL domain-containing protein [Nitrincola tapanii]